VTGEPIDEPYASALILLHFTQDTKKVMILYNIITFLFNYVKIILNKQ